MSERPDDDPTADMDTLLGVPGPPPEPDDETDPDEDDCGS